MAKEDDVACDGPMGQEGKEKEEGKKRELGRTVM